MVWSKFYSQTDGVYALNKTGNILAYSCINNRDCIKIWDIEKNEEFILEKRPVNSLAFHPDGNILASGNADGNIKLWNIKERREIAILNHCRLIRLLAFNPNGKILATGSRDNTIKLWDIDTQKELDTFKSDGEIVSINFHNNEILVCRSKYKIVQLWKNIGKLTKKASSQTK